MSTIEVQSPGEPVRGVSTRRERVGWYFYDWANSAFYTTVVTVFFGPFLTAVTKQAAGCDPSDKCVNGVVHPLGIEVAVGSYFPYVVSVSVFLTVFVLPVAGAIADRIARKRLLLAVNLVAVTVGEAAGLDTLDLARWSLASAGVWWGGFTLLPLLWLRDRP